MSASMRLLNIGQISALWAHRTEDRGRITVLVFEFGPPPPSPGCWDAHQHQSFRWHSVRREFDKLGKERHCLGLAWLPTIFILLRNTQKGGWVEGVGGGGNWSYMAGP